MGYIKWLPIGLASYFFKTLYIEKNTPTLPESFLKVTFSEIWSVFSVYLCFFLQCIELEEQVEAVLKECPLHLLELLTVRVRDWSVRRGFSTSHA